MNSQRFILAGFAGAVVYFLLGFLVYGLLLEDFMKSAVAPGSMRASADMIWWALIAANLAFGFLLAYLVYRTGITNATAGSTFGLVFGLLFAIGMDLMSYSMSTMMTKPVFILVDVAATAVMCAITAGVVAWVYNYHSKTVIAA
ncbi:MAG: DUF1761 family protein [Candidatus Dadabacteria bacterium]